MGREPAGRREAARPLAKRHQRHLAGGGGREQTATRNPGVVAEGRAGAEPGTARPRVLGCEATGKRSSYTAAGRAAATPASPMTGSADRNRRATGADRTAGGERGCVMP